MWNEFAVGLLTVRRQFGTTNYSGLFAALTRSAAPVVGSCPRQFFQGLGAGAVKI